MRQRADKLTSIQETEWEVVVAAGSISDDGPADVQIWMES